MRIDLMQMLRHEWTDTSWSASAPSREAMSAARQTNQRVVRGHMNPLWPTVPCRSDDHAGRGVCGALWASSGLRSRLVRLFANLNSKSRLHGLATLHGLSNNALAWSNKRAWQWLA